MRKLNQDIFKQRRKTIIFLFSLFVYSILLAIVPIKMVGLNSPNEDKSVLIEVQSGNGVFEIAGKLESGGIIESRLKFVTFVVLSGQTKNLKSGNYILNEKMSYFDAIDRLVKGPRISDKKLYTVIIPEGFTAAQVAARLEKNMGLSGERLKEILLEGEGLDSSVPAKIKNRPIDSLEGYLFPKTYLFSEGDDEIAVAKEILLQFDKETSTVNLKTAKAKEFDLHEIITIASLIEKEVRVEGERNLVSAVIYNRLKKGMPLQIDATVQYVLAERKENLTLEDLKFDSPYNTYIHPALPPGPICNPGIASIKAAANPADVNYLYYVLSGSDGSHTFTSSYEEFQAAKAKAKRNGF